MKEYDRLLAIPVEERFYAIEESLSNKKISVGDAQALIDSLNCLECSFPIRHHNQSQCDNCGEYINGYFPE